MKKLLFLALATLVFAEICPVTSDADEVAANILYGAVNVKTEDSIIKQPYHTSVAGKRTITALHDGFPLTCTTCDPWAPTEYCDYDTGVCFKLTNSDISLFSTNGSLLYSSPYALDSQCTPRYLQKLNGRKYAIVCKESSYQLFELAEDGSPVLRGIERGANGATDGILVQSVSSSTGETSLYHVEVLHDVVVVAFDVGVSRLFEIPTHHTNGCFFKLKPTFSSSGLFLLSCTMDTGSQFYILKSAKHPEYHQRLDLCTDPLPCPPGSSGEDTFTVACADGLTVYKTTNVTNNCSASFGDSITNAKYLDQTTLLLDTGNQHHIVDIERFMQNGGSEGVVMLNNTATCFLIQKLITPGIYATACGDGPPYEVRIVNRTSGQSLAPIENLASEPQDIYFEAQEPPLEGNPENTGTPPASSTPDSTTDISSPSDKPIAPTEITNSIWSTATAPRIPTESQTPSDSPPTPLPATTHHAVIGTASVVIFIVLTLLVFLFIFIVSRRTRSCLPCRRQRWKPSVEEQGGGDTQTYVMGTKHPTASLRSGSGSSGHNSCTSSI